MSSLPPDASQEPGSLDPPPSPYTAPQSQLVTGKPENYLAWAILATLCCCLPAGIPAIVYAAQVDGKWAAGDHAGAQQSSENAKLWSLISLGLGVVSGLIYAGLNVMAVSNGQ